MEVEVFAVGVELAEEDAVVSGVEDAVGGMLLIKGFRIVIIVIKEIPPIGHVTLL